MLEDETRGFDNDLGRRLAEVALGMDRLERGLSRARGEPEAEGLVPIYIGGDLVEPATLDDWQDATERLDALSATAGALPAGGRRTYVIAMLRSLRAAAELLDGQTLSFRDKLERLVGVPAAAVPDDHIATLQSDLDAALQRAGYRHGGLGERVRRWEAAGHVDASELEPLFTELMDEAQRRTDARVFATGDYSMRLHLVTDVPYSARCRFDDGLMDLNADLSFGRAALKHLVAHEVFPGHSTQLLFTLERARSGASPLDVLLCTANAATGAIQEGIGDQGLHLIDWVDSQDDVIHGHLRRLRSAAATSAAWFLMGESWPEERVRSFLHATAFPQDAWVEGRLRFAADPFKGAFLASYWFGDEAVREVRERTPEARFEAFIEELYGHLNTPASLRMFA